MAEKDPIMEFLNDCSVRAGVSGTTATILSSHEAKKDTINIPQKKMSDKITKEFSAGID